MAVVVELEPKAEVLVELLYVLEEVLEDAGVKEATAADDVELSGSCVPVLTLL
jgi:hypothetical protein